jgi:hypothetical protein
MPYAVGGFPDHGERPVARYPPWQHRDAADVRHRVTRTQGVARKIAARRPRFAAFAQILGKLNFFKLGENLQRILVDYAEKRSSTANATFKRAC